MTRNVTLRRDSARALPPRVFSHSPGILAQGTHAHYFLELDLKSGVTPEETVTCSASCVLRACPRVGESGERVRGGGLGAVAPGLVPADLASFQTVVGADGRSVPPASSAPRDWADTGTRPSAPCGTSSPRPRPRSARSASFRPGARSDPEPPPPADLPSAPARRCGRRPAAQA